MQDSRSSSGTPAPRRQLSPVGGLLSSLVEQSLIGFLGLSEPAQEATGRDERGGGRGGGDTGAQSYPSSVGSPRSRAS